MFFPLPIRNNLPLLLPNEELISTYEGGATFTFNAPSISNLSYDPNRSFAYYSNTFVLNLIKFQKFSPQEIENPNKKIFYTYIYAIIMNPKVIKQVSTIFLTNFRLILIGDDSKDFAYGIALDDIVDLEDRSSFFKSKPIDLEINSRFKYFFNLLEQSSEFFFSIQIKLNTVKPAKFISEVNKEKSKNNYPKNIRSIIEYQAFPSDYSNTTTTTSNISQTPPSNPTNLSTSTSSTSTSSIPPGFGIARVQVPPLPPSSSSSELPRGYSSFPQEAPPLAQQAPPVTSQGSGTLYTAGISGVLKRQEEKQKYVEDLTKESLKDFKTLLEKAKEIMQVIERYSHELEQAQKEGKEDKEEEEDLYESIVKMGLIQNPISKSDSGKNYYNDLAFEIGTLINQTNLLSYYSSKKKKKALTEIKFNIKDENSNLYDVSLPFPPRFTKILLLNDLYCIVNRRRGKANLISPNDLVSACRVLETIPELNLALITLKNGTKIIKEVKNCNKTTNKLNLPNFESINESKSILTLNYFTSNLNIIKKLNSKEFENEITDDNLLYALHLCQFFSYSYKNCYNTFEIAKFFDLPLDIIENYLLKCENVGLICRDNNSYDGTKFYLNLFLFI